MKKIYYISILILTIIFFNCSNPTVKEESSGNIVIQAPDLINPPNMSLMASTGAGAISQINTATLDQDNFRYQVTVESRGKRLAYAVLKRNDKKSISVIAGIPLDIYVSVYYAISRSSDDEKYNVFLAADSLTDFIIMSGESKKVELALDITKRLPVDTYYNTTLFGSRGFASITGGAISSATLSSPHFSIKAYDATNSSVIYYNSNTFNSYATIPGTATSFNGRNVLVRNNYDPSNLTYWYIQRSTGGNSGIYRSQFGETTTSVLALAPPSEIENLENIKLVKDIHISFGTLAVFNYYFYFLIHNNGYYGLYAGGTGAVTLSSYTYTDTSNFNNIYPSDPFLTDVKRDPISLNGTSSYIATKNGLFYINQATLLNYVNGNLSQALSMSKKLIKITDSNNNNILITKIEDGNSIDNRIYLGTKKGIYYFIRNNSEFNDFINSPTSEMTIFNQNNITKFDLDEPVSELKIFNIGTAFVLVAITPKRVYFYNMTNGKKTSITIWDGLPFIPIYGNNLPSYNNLEYKIHELAPINAVIWNSTNSKFWIATDFGLASIDLNKLGI